MSNPTPITPAPDATDYFSSDHPLRATATKIALRARQRMFAKFAAFAQPTENMSVVDIGVTPDRELADSNFFELMYPYPQSLTATSIEDASFLEQLVPGVQFIQTDGTTLPFDDRQFDVSFSSAVLEHVGETSAQRAFVAEMCRVSDRFFLTTPNRWFPVEVHTFLPLVHWLPRSIHRRLLRLVGKPFWAEPTNLHLVSATDLESLFPSGTSVTVHRQRTLGLTSNLVACGRWSAGPRRSTARATATATGSAPEPASMSPVSAGSARAGSSPSTTG